jgi:hypothetical protein
MVFSGSFEGGALGRFTAEKAWGSSTVASVGKGFGQTRSCPGISTPATT